MTSFIHASDSPPPYVELPPPYVEPSKAQIAAAAFQQPPPPPYYSPSFPTPSAPSAPEAGPAGPLPRVTSPPSELFDPPEKTRASAPPLEPEGPAAWHEEFEIRDNHYDLPPADYVVPESKPTTADLIRMFPGLPKDVAETEKKLSDPSWVLDMIREKQTVRDFLSRNNQYAVEPKLPANIVRYLSERVRNDWRLMTMAVWRDSSLLPFAGDQLLSWAKAHLIKNATRNRTRRFTDPQSARIAIRYEKRNIELAPDNMPFGRAEALILVAACGLGLRALSDAQRDDPEIVLAALKSDGNALQFASARFQADPDTRTFADWYKSENQRTRLYAKATQIGPGKWFFPIAFLGESKPTYHLRGGPRTPQIFHPRPPAPQAEAGAPPAPAVDEGGSASRLQRAAAAAIGYISSLLYRAERRI